MKLYITNPLLIIFILSLFSLVIKGSWLGSNWYYLALTYIGGLIVVINLLEKNNNVLKCFYETPKIAEVFWAVVFCHLIYKYSPFVSVTTTNFSYQSSSPLSLIALFFILPILEELVFRGGYMNT